MRVLMLAQVVPYAADAGVCMAILSDLQALASCGCEIELFAYSYPDQRRGRLEWPSETVPVRPGDRPRRFFRSLGTGWPAAIERYYSPEAEKQLRATLKRLRPELTIIQDVALGGWLPVIREYQTAPVVVRAHHFMADASHTQFLNSPYWLSPVFRRERRLWIEMERAALAGADATWAITQIDADRLRAEYATKEVAYLPVSIDFGHYCEIPVEEGDPNVFVQIGSIDARKGRGIERFIRRAWPKIRQINGRAQLLLAGRCTYGTRLSGPGVSYLGPVPDDAALYRSARFSVNSQTVSGGIKLKSLTSMAAGRVLISTALGMEGIPACHGIHYYNLEALEAKADGFRELFENPQRSKAVAQAGRELVSLQHSENSVREAAATLLARLSL